MFYSFSELVLNVSTHLIEIQTIICHKRLFIPIGYALAVSSLTYGARDTSFILSKEFWIKNHLSIHFSA